MNNTSGILLGAVDSYVPSFDPQIINMNERIKADKESWTIQAEQPVEKKKAKCDIILAKLTTLRADIAEQMKPIAGIDVIVSECVLKDLPCVGRRTSELDKEFRWSM